MTSINSNYFNVASFQKSGIDVSSKKMTDEEIAKLRSALGMDTPVAATKKTEHSNDPLAVEKGMRQTEGRVATPQTKVSTQILAEQETPSAGDKAVADFLDFTSKSWEERMRAMILSSLGLKEEDLANMSPEEVAKIEAKIKEKIKQEVEKETGIPLAEA